MRRIFVVLILAGAFAGPTVAQPVVTAVVNKASYNAVVSPNCWVVIAGYNFAASSLTAPIASTPTTLGGVSVTVAGLPASLLSVSPNEIDALIPSQAAIPQNTVVPLVVTSGAGSVTYNIRLTRNSPALFISSNGLALVFDAGFRPVGTVGPQDTLILYATGLGPTDSSGRVVDEVEVYIGERRAQVLFAGLASGFPGIYQLNVTAPPPATDRIYLRSGGWQSNIVNIGIRSGTNTVNVKGTIDGVNPSSDLSYPKTPQRPCLGDNDPGPCGPTLPLMEEASIILHAGTFTVSFDIVPGAGPFAVAAVGEAGGSIISIDPAAGTYTASVTTLAPSAAHGDFSNSIAQLWYYSTCDWKSAVCQQFPNSTVPASTFGLYWVRAIQMLPAPNTTAAASPNAFLQVSGSLSGSRFAVDAQNNSSLSTFGGIVQVPYGPFEAGVSTFSLYVDGKLIVSKNLPYLLHQRAPQNFGPGDF